MIKLKTIFGFTALIFISSTASALDYNSNFPNGLYATNSNADCIGSDAFKTCWNENGNTYDIQKFGNMTTMQGTNSDTGTTWSQDSMTIGNTTYIDGTAGNGNSWDSTIMDIGGTTYIDGTDSSGNNFSSVCNQYGCY